MSSLCAVNMVFFPCILADSPCTRPVIAGFSTGRCGQTCGKCVKPPAGPFMVRDYVNQLTPVGKLFLGKISLLPLTGWFSGAIMRSAQESRYGSPVLTPGLSQRVNMEITVPEVPALFCCDVGALPAAHILILSGVAFPSLTQVIKPMKISGIKRYA